MALFYDLDSTRTTIGENGNVILLAELYTKNEGGTPCSYFFDSISLTTDNPSSNVNAFVVAHPVTGYPSPTHEITCDPDTNVLVQIEIDYRGGATGDSNIDLEIIGRNGSINYNFNLDVIYDPVRYLSAITLDSFEEEIIGTGVGGFISTPFSLDFSVLEMPALTGTVSYLSDFTILETSGSETYITKNYDSFFRKGAGKVDLTSASNIQTTLSSSALIGVYSHTYEVVPYLATTVYADTEHKFTVQDADSVITNGSPFNIASLTNGDLLVSFTDADGLSSVDFLSTPIAGVSFNSSNGNITVSDVNLLTVSTHTIELETNDNYSGVTYHLFDIEFVFIDTESTLDSSNNNVNIDVVNATSNYSFFTFSDDDGSIVSSTLVSGTIPSFINLSNDGSITRNGNDITTQGVYSFTIETEDSYGGVTEHSLTITLFETESTIVYEPFKKPIDYVNGDVVVSFFDVDGSVNLSLTSGDLPQGLSISGHQIIVSNNSLVEAIENPVFEITTLDSTGGITTHDVLIDLKDTLPCFGIVQKTCYKIRRPSKRTTSIIPPTNPTLDCCSCVYKRMAFAEKGTNTDDSKNDFTTMLFVLENSTDTIDFTLDRFTGSWVQEFDLNASSSFGDFKDVGFNPDTPDMIYTTLDWFSVLNEPTLGEGMYRIQAVINGTDKYYTHTFCLLEYNDARADDTVRIDFSLSNTFGSGTNEFQFGNITVKDSIRIRGYFGNEISTYEVEEFEYPNGQKDFIRHEILSSYTLRTGLIPNTVHDKLKQYMALSTDIKITDYNLNNDKKYLDLPVLVSDSYNIEHNVNATEHKAVVVFQDKIKNKEIKKYC